MRGLFLVFGVMVSLAAGARIAHAQDAGSSGGACYGNGTCNAGLTCDAGVCVAPQAGQMGGACYGNGTCNAGMSCDAATQTCVGAAGGPPATGVPPAGGGLTPPPATGTPPAGGGTDGMAPAAAAAPAAAVTAEAPPGPPKRWWVGAKAGFLMGGSATQESDFGESDFDTKSGLFLTGGVDVAMGPKLSIGGYAFYASTGVDVDGGPDASITTLGANIKGRFVAGKAEIRPGAAVGYQMMSGDAFEGIDDSKGLGVGGLVEVAFPMTPQADFLGEIGFISQPTGGAEDYDLTFGPIFYIVGGASFGG